MLDRRANVYKLETEELGDDLDTLPFISHHTLNISRDVTSEFPGQHIHSSHYFITGLGSVLLCLHLHMGRSTFYI